MPDLERLQRIAFDTTDEHAMTTYFREMFKRGHITDELWARIQDTFDGALSTGLYPLVSQMALAGDRNALYAAQRSAQISNDPTQWLFAYGLQRANGRPPLKDVWAIPMLIERYAHRLFAHLEAARRELVPRSSSFIIAGSDSRWGTIESLWLSLSTDSDFQPLHAHLRNHGAPGLIELMVNNTYEMLTSDAHHTAQAGGDFNLTYEVGASRNEIGYSEGFLLEFLPPTDEAGRLEGYEERDTRIRLRHFNAYISRTYSGSEVESEVVFVGDEELVAGPVDFSHNDPGLEQLVAWLDKRVDLLDAFWEV